MKQRMIVASMIGLGIAAGCGGDDGGAAADAAPDTVPDALPLEQRPLPSLTADERTALCHQFVDLFGGEGFETKCPNFTFVGGTYAECEAAFADTRAPQCTATVAQVLECGAATAASPCTFGDNSVACMTFHACF
jgi:hypothetical protein